MLGRLDRYCGRIVLASYTATLLFVVALFVIIDLLLNMGNYLEVAEKNQLSLVAVLGLWLRYQVVSLPWTFVVVAPFVSVVSCMFAVARLMAANEVVPMVFTGRSMLRILAPALTMGMLSAGAMVVAWEFLLPQASRSMSSLAKSLDRDDGGDAENIVLFSPNQQKRLMCDAYLPDRQRMEGVVVLDTGSHDADLSEIRASAAVWNPELADWELENGQIWSGAHRQPRDRLSMEGVTPENVWLSGKEQRGTFLFGYSEIAELTRLSPGRPDLVISLHYHFTWPLANLLLLLLALPFAVQFERGSRTGRTVFAVLVCGSYLIVDVTCQSFGRNDWLHPVIAAWTPTILFGSLGLVMFGSMRT